MLFWTTTRGTARQAPGSPLRLTERTATTYAWTCGSQLLSGARFALWLIDFGRAAPGTTIAARNTRSPSQP